MKKVNFYWSYSESDFGTMLGGFNGFLIVFDLV